MRSHKDTFAIALIAIGILLILSFFNITILGDFNLGNIISVLWPLFIMIPGINMLKRKISLPGILLTLMGASFLLENVLELFNANYEGSSIFRFFWPIILIYFGYKLLVGDRKVKIEHDFDSISDKYDEETNTQFTGISLNSKKFIYTESEMKEGLTTLNLNISLGGAEIIVEEGIQVFLIGQYTLGGYEFFKVDAGGFHDSIKEMRYPEDGAYFDKTLIVKANIALGGLEIRNK